MGVLGFNTAPKVFADFLPFVKYHAPAGRMFRVDREQVGGAFENNEVDITNIFKAQFDFENLEVGWLKFAAGQAPSLVLVPFGSLFPPEPMPPNSHKEGARWMLKLSKECADGTPTIREIAGNASSMMAGVDAVMADYLAEKDKHAGLLPVVTLVKTMPVKTGTAERASTNYQPVFQIVDWKPRGDLVFVPKAGAVANTARSTAPAGSGGVPNAATAPTTGSTRATAPVAPAPQAPAPKQTVAADDDFG
jgi:hypothetical protein